ncbi:MAG: magnesium transporter [Candidatus Roizmanbacteria bacterium]|nr:MAG: magnesium transporter [Candidatus Roizmanbacteria bacterium]
MLYFSELKGKQVCTEDRVFVGKLEDLAFLVSDTPKITKLIVKDKENNYLNIPSSTIESINHQIIISKQFESQNITNQELLLNKNLLDQQIIDIEGNKVVRVNDVAINDRPGYYIAGADIGILGILRRLGIEDMISRILINFGVKITSKFLSWADIQPLELARGMVILKTEQDKLKKIRPEDLADYLEKINIVNADRILKSLDEDFAVDIIKNLNINYQSAIFKQFSPEKAAHVVSIIDPDEAVDILLTLSEKKREEILFLLNTGKQKELRHLFKMSQSPIGEKMTTQFLTATPDTLVKEVISKIKKEAADFSFLNYIYVLNKEDKLVGVFSLHEMILQNLDTPVYKFMTQNAIVIHLTTPKEIALAKMFKYKLNAVPIIDQNRHVLGIVAFDDLPEIVFGRLR